jgi:hypothetical protein
LYRHVTNLGQMLVNIHTATRCHVGYKYERRPKKVETKKKKIDQTSK